MMISSRRSNNLSFVLLFLVVAAALATVAATAVSQEQQQEEHQQRRRRQLGLRHDRKGFFRGAGIPVEAETSEIVAEQEENEAAQANQNQYYEYFNTHPRPEPRIIGGSRPDDRSRYNYFALMNGSSLCGAVLVGARWILTAAHCAYADDDFEIGTTSRNTDFLSSLFGGGGGDGITYEYKRGRIHPNYSDNDVSHDIAVFELENLVPSSVATPILLRKESFTRRDSGTSLTAIGFGDTDKSSSVTDTSEYLREVQVSYVEQQTCSRQFGSNWYSGSYIEDGMLCAYSYGKDSCGGDSGGPLILKGSSPSGYNDELIGIVSWGISCADDEYPGVYTRISYYYDWIVDTMCELNPDSIGLPAGVVCPNNNNGGSAPVPSPVYSPVSSPVSSPVYSPVYSPPVSSPVAMDDDDDYSWDSVEDFLEDAYDWVCSLFGCRRN